MQNLDVAIDLGTSRIRIYLPGKGVVLDEPAVLTVDRDTDEIVAIGTEALKMQGKLSERLATVFPVRDGVISNYGFTETLLTEFVRAVCGSKVFMPRAVVCVPNLITELEQRAVCQALHNAGARKVCLIGEAIAAAIGADIDITVPHGCMIVDIGAGTTDIGVMTLNGMASFDSIKVAGNSFDSAIIRYMKNKHDLIIGPVTAERIKKEIGCAVPRDFRTYTRVSGRSALNGLPLSVSIASDEIAEALEEHTIAIVRRVQHVLENTPPELVGDIYTDGIILTGGSAQLHGMDRLIERKTKLNVVVANNPSNCAILGTGAALKYMDSYDNDEFKTSPLQFAKY
ncbi:MAG: rod shape-determining protein [Clostridia bacterium]|nr:rod shape-determining protein [Clostridia bacterium]